MNCQEVIELMQRQLDHDLNAQEEELMWAHLEHCLDCANMFERLEKLSIELTNLPKVEPAYSLVDAILPKLDEIDLQAATAGRETVIPLVTTASGTGVVLPHKLPWTRRFGSQISWKIAGGVVAAGLAIGFFIFGTKNPISENADSFLQPRSKAESKASTSAGAANKSDSAQESALTNNLKVMDQKSDAKAASPAASANASEQVAKGNEPVPTASPIESPSSKAVQPAQQEPLPTGSSDKNQKGYGENPLPTNEPAATHGASSPTPAPALEPGESAQVTPTGARKDTAGEEKVPDSGASSPPVKSITPPPPFASIMAKKFAELNSPDGKYVALVEQQKVIIRDASKNGIVFSSEKIWSESDQVTLLSWSEDNKLTYEVTSGTQTQAFAIDMSAKTETALSK